MNPAKANTKGPSQVEVISSAIETSLGGLLTALFKKEHYVDVKLFPRGVELIEVQAKVGLPNAPLEFNSALYFSAFCFCSAL